MVRFRMLGAAAVIAVGLVGATAASAAPFGHGSLGGDALIERVADGCGRGFHLNPWGHCRPNDRGYDYGYGYGGPRGYYDGPRRAYGGYDRFYGGGGYDGGYGGGGYDRPRRFYDGY